MCFIASIKASFHFSLFGFFVPVHTHKKRQPIHTLWLALKLMLRLALRLGISYNIKTNVRTDIRAGNGNDTDSVCSPD